MPANIEYLCAEHGRAMATSGDDESVINHALGVLQENGVYAMFLFCASRTEAHRQVADRIGQQAVDLLRCEGIGLLGDQVSYAQTPDAQAVLFPALTHLSASVPNLLFAKDLLERALIYARYHAKAL